MLEAIMLKIERTMSILDAEPAIEKPVMTENGCGGLDEGHHEAEKMGCLGSLLSAPANLTLLCGNNGLGCSLGDGDLCAVIRGLVAVTWTS